MRRLAILLLLACAAPAQAAPRQVAKAPADAALAGDQILLATVEGRAVRVHTWPSGQSVFGYDAPEELHPDVHLAASPQRAALTLTLSEGVSDIRAAQTLIGPPLGPWTPLGPMAKPAGFPWLHQVDGARVFSTEFRGSIVDTVFVVRDDGLELPLPYDAVFAGDLVAHSERAPGQGADDVGRRVVLANWRTGQRLRVTELAAPVERLALSRSGRVAVKLQDRDGIYEVRGRVRRVYPRPVAFDGGLAYAGEHLVFGDEDRLRVIDPAGRVRAFGTRTEDLGDFTTDDGRVLWQANGCLLLADVTDAAARFPAPGPCPRSEISVAEREGNVRLARSLPVKVRCVTAPTRCRGTLRLKLDARRLINRPVRYAIDAGRSRTIRVPLTDRGYRLVRRAVDRDGDAGVAVVPRPADGDRLPDDASTGILVLPR